jgi:outer membrane lipoprotein LolB
MNILLLIFIFILTGCTTLSSQPCAVQNNIPWPERVSSLSKAQHWDIHAVMAMQVPARHEGGSLHLAWCQQRGDYTIQLFGPLGVNSMQLEGGTHGVSLKAADGRQWTAPTPERLLEEQTGWRLPVSYLYYWIRGLPAPVAIVKQQWDSQHRLYQLIQQGWTVTFLRYTFSGCLEVPEKLMLDNQSVKIKIFINQWIIYN